jgi:DNA-binding winged helix-turn-helix (wHTH) protein/Flp pilus assembly protein TadD
MGTSIYQLGHYRVDLSTGVVENGGEPVVLNYKARQALRLLIEAGGEPVAREALFETLWPGQAVDESSLTKCISQIRQALGNGAEAEAALETIPRVGYRLRVTAAPEEARGAGARPEWKKRRGALIAACLAGSLAAAAWGYSSYADWAQRRRVAERAETLFARAEEMADRRTPEAAAAAVRLYNDAIALRPDQARYYAALSQALNRAVNTIDGRQPMEALEAARKAAELDPACLPCQISYGFFLFYYGWRWEEADQRLEMARRLAPESPDIAANRSMLLAARGRLGEAEKEIGQAIAGKPYRSTWHSIRAGILYFQGRHAEALAAADKAIALEQRNNAGWDWRSRSLHFQGRGQESLGAMLAGPHAALKDRVPAGGAPEAGFRRLLELTSDAVTLRTHPWRRAIWCMQAGDTEAALQELERAYALRNVNLLWLNVDPMYAPLRGEARFRTIVRGMGLEPAPRR